MKKYLGIDIGTESIGWALTDENYGLLSYKKHPMWGVHLFDPAENCDIRRKNRGVRRASRRRKWRISILQELFDAEITKVDENFFARIKYYQEGLFTEGDKAYFKKFPTIHHLIKYLQGANAKPDIRWVYLACSYYMKHRGHFYSNIDAEAGFDEILNLKDTFDDLLEDVKNRFDIDIEYENISDVEDALRQDGKNKTKSALKQILSVNGADGDDLLKRFIELISNSKVNLADLFPNNECDEKINIKDEDFDGEKIEKIRMQLGDDFELLEKAKRVADWMVLRLILKDETSINAQRLALYETVKADRKLRGAALTEFMKARHKENRVIPYQLQWADFRIVLDKISRFYPELDTEKIGLLFKHKIPYYVGPLKKGEFGWLEKNVDEKIYPWNFEKVIDIEKTHEAFIRRMTAKCTYLAGEDVLAKESLLYAKFMVLNQLNTITIDGNRIDNELKKRLFNAMYIEQNGTVSISKIKKWLGKENLVNNNTVIRGVDTILEGNLKAYHNFKIFLDEGKLGQPEAEEIINRITVFGSEKSELTKWMGQAFSNLSQDDIKRILRFSYAKYGRFSRKLLEGVLCDEMSIIQMMWETNNNFMELLSDKFGYKEKIDKINQEKINPELDLNEWLDEYYVSNRVKRSIFRSIDIIDELIELKGKPDKIFIEMARGEEDKKRTASRKKELENLLAGNIELLSELSGYEESDLRQKKLFLYFSQKGRCMYTGKKISLTSLMSSNWDIDHIWPRAYVKDDSIRKNLVLVDKTANGEKGDLYPVFPKWQSERRVFWEELKSQGLISDEKYARLIRSADFSEDEKVNFINRQLVETRQTTKILAQLLKDKYDIRPIYVKAGLVTEFRHIYDYHKCREINDYHHAKDAYLNIVCGNVHDLVFTNVRALMRSASKFSVKPEVLYSKRDWLKNNWQKNTHDIIRHTMQSNRIKYTEFAYEKKGDLWGKTLGRVPRKLEKSPKSDKDKFELSTRFFALVSYQKKNKEQTRLVPIYNYRFEEFVKDKTHYFKEIYPKLNEKFSGDEVEFIRIVKIKSIVMKDGVRYRVTGNTGMSHTYQFILANEQEEYLRKLCKAIEKNDYRGLTAEDNMCLFKAFKNKLEKSIYSQISSLRLQLQWFDEEKFKMLKIDQQAAYLKNALNLFTANKILANLTLIDEKASKTAGQMIMPTKSDFDYVIDQSPTGFYEKKYKIKRGDT